MPSPTAWRPSRFTRGLLPGAVLLLGLLTACAPSRPAPVTPTTAVVSLTITADGQTQTYQLPSELTVREAIAQANLPLNETDRLAPPPYTRLSEGLAIIIVRVTETYETEKTSVPYTAEIVRRDDLPEGQQRLIQAGVNGEQEITYRVTFENGVQVSRIIVKRTLLQAPVPEIKVVGSQSTFTLVPITGTLVYLNGHNVWLMRQNSSQRLPLTTTGDVDGRIFELSADGQWLLFTRVLTDPTATDFNTLWALPVPVTQTATLPLRLNITNTLYAEWSPVTPRTVAYSTGLKISHPPGWQANNDLWLTTWEDVWNKATRKTQRVFTATQILDTSSGGAYGWWGTGFAFAPDGARLAYAQADALGVIDLATGVSTELATYVPYNTHAEWAWYPPLRWSHDGQYLYTQVHGPPLGLELPEDSPGFDLVALAAANGMQLTLIPRTGMYAQPLPSPQLPSATAEQPYLIAFMQVMDPESDSAKSRYRLGVMDRDGSNLRFIFPPDGQPGLLPNAVYAWSPDGQRLAVIYNDNLWLVDVASGVSQQITGDALSLRVAWGP